MMRRNRCGSCMPSRWYGGVVARIAGIFLIVTGLLLLIVCIPFQFWSAILGLLIAVIGWLIFRVG